jgi:HSP20 family protein
MATGLTRWEPFAELAELRDRLDRAYGEMVSGEDRIWAPRIDLVRERDRIVVHAELPGIKPEEAEISVEGDVLTISGRHEQTEEEKEKHFVRRERRYGSFSRSIPLPHGVDPDQIEAEYRDGVLEVSIPVPAEKEAKKVQIKPRTRE